MESIEQVLREFGLSDNETKVYLAALSLGTSKVHEISKKAGLLRTTTYEVLKSLVKAGLVSYVIKSGVRSFEAGEPKKLVYSLEEKKDKLSLILPELEKLKKSVTEKPTIEMYEGKDGLKSILDDIIASKPGEILQLNSAKIFQTLEFSFPHWIDRRIKARIGTRILQEKVSIIKDLKKKDASTLREIRFLPKGFKIDTSNFIYKNKIAILTMKEQEIIGVIIENRDIAQTQRSQFEILWRMAR